MWSTNNTEATAIPRDTNVLADQPFMTADVEENVANIQIPLEPHDVSVLLQLP